MSIPTVPVRHISPEEQSARWASVFGDGCVNIPALETLLREEFRDHTLAPDPKNGERLHHNAVSPKDIKAWLYAHGIDADVGLDPVNTGLILFTRGPVRRKETFHSPDRVDALAYAMGVSLPRTAPRHPIRSESFYRNHVYDDLSDRWESRDDYVTVRKSQFDDVKRELREFRGDFPEACELFPLLAKGYAALRRQKRMSPEETATYATLIAEIAASLGGKTITDSPVEIARFALTTHRLLEAKMKREELNPTTDTQRANALADKLTETEAKLREVRADRDEMREQLERAHR